MAKQVFKSNRGGFMKKNDAFLDMAMGRMAMLVEVALKTTAGMPVSNTKASGNSRGGGGHMKSETRFFKNGRGKWRTEVDKQYAAYQERGARQDGSHPVRNYSTPGTSSGYFRRAIDTLDRQRDSVIHEARVAVGL